MAHVMPNQTTLRTLALPLACLSLLEAIAGKVGDVVVESGGLVALPDRVVR